MQRICVGVDAGGSSTLVAVQGARSPLRVHAAGAANLHLDTAARTISDEIAAALGGDTPAAIAVGAAGAGDAAARRLEDVLRERFPAARVSVEEDVWIALRAAVPEGDGAVLVCGTGSIAAARVDGARTRVGGHGYRLGDDGSGYAIGSAALRALLRALDGRQPLETMYDALLEQLDCSDAPCVLARAYAPGGTALIASCAPIVIARADAGERTAGKIVQTAALELSELVKALLQRANGTSRALPLALCGGLLESNSLLTFLLETRIAHDLPQVHLIKQPPEPYLGALHRARELLDA